MTNLKPRRAVTRTRDHDGAPIVLMTLPNGNRAKVLAEDYDRMIGLGVSPNWKLNRNGDGTGYVRAKLSGGLGWGDNAQIARLVVCPALRGVVVRYRDGDRLNLRADNLEQVRWRTAAKAREARCMVPDEFAQVA